MSFKEKGKIIGHVNIDGVMVPKYRGETEVTLTNTKTGKEYNSDKEAEEAFKIYQRIKKDQLLLLSLKEKI